MKSNNTKSNNSVKAEYSYDNYMIELERLKNENAGLIEERDRLNAALEKEREKAAEFDEMRERADKWDILNSTGITKQIRGILKNMDYALIECSALQQLVINAADEDCECDKIQDIASIRCATKRLMDITHDIFFCKDELNEILG